MDIVRLNFQHKRLLPHLNLYASQFGQWPTFFSNCEYLRRCNIIYIYPCHFYRFNRCENHWSPHYLSFITSMIMGQIRKWRLTSYRCVLAEHGTQGSPDNLTPIRPLSLLSVRNRINMKIGAILYWSVSCKLFPSCPWRPISCHLLCLWDPSLHLLETLPQCLSSQGG